jgi:hypothetical protein
MSKTYVLPLALMLLGTLSWTSRAFGQQSHLPYFLAFTHPTVDVRLHCNTEFGAVQDAIYQDYVNDLIATTNLTETIATEIDPSWSTTTSPLTNESNIHHRELSCSRYCNQALAIIITKRCCNFCGVHGCRRRALTKNSANGKDDVGVGSIRRNVLETTVTVVPVRDETTGDLIVMTKGNSTVLDTSVTTVPGTAIAREFYTTVQMYLDVNDPCREILLGTNYEVMAMTTETE